jgi:beta-fructofuranosidase
MYHGTQLGNMVATSSDPLLLNWDKVTGTAVIPMKNADGSTPPYRVFDPCIWKKGDFYYSLSGGTLPGPASKRKRANFLLRSPDLAEWEYLHPFVEDDLFTLVGDDGACPYFWPIGDRHMLIFYSHMSGGQYLLGDYDKERDKFVVTSHDKCNFGASGPGGVHAPSATPDGEGGLIVIFNMNPAKPTEKWNQIMTLPRRMTLEGDEEVLVEPAGDVESLRYDHKHVGSTKLPANQEIVLDGIEGNSMEIAAEIDVGGAPMVEMNVFRSPDNEEHTRIMFFKNRGFRNRVGIVGELSGVKPHSTRTTREATPVDSRITIDSSYSSISPDVMSRPPETGSVYIGPEETLQLRVFVDRSVVEVFVNGKQCVAMRVYPEREDNVGVSLRSQGRDSELKSLDAWQMSNIYE